MLTNAIRSISVSYKLRLSKNVKVYTNHGGMYQLMRISLSFPEELGDTCEEVTLTYNLHSVEAILLSSYTKHLIWMCSWAAIPGHVWAVCWRWAASCIAH